MTEPAATALTPKDLPELTDAEITVAAMSAGFMLSTAHGQSTNKLMPVSDRATLIAFARAIQHAAYELGARSTAAQPVESSRIAALEARTGMFTLPEAANAKTGEWLCIRFNTFEDRTAAWRAINGQNVDVPPGAAASGDSTPPSEPADGEQLWLWQNGDHFLAFRNLYPCYSPGGDPMTLGEPFGRAIFKHSHNREGKPNEQQRTDRQSPRSGADLDLQRRHTAGAGQADAAGAIASVGHGQHPIAPQGGWGAGDDSAGPQPVPDIAGATGVLAAGRNVAQGVAAHSDPSGALRPEPEAAGQASLSLAARDVLAERRRQVEVEDWTPEHDDEHSNGEMAEAAACYAASAHVPASLKKRRLPAFWPWAKKWWKPSDPRRDLIKAGALILAEIERLDRKVDDQEPTAGSSL